MGHRSVKLDALRGIAILLVLGRHLNMQDLWRRTGWLGVDLFFVISGFLISGLLFSEYVETGKIKVGRFWVRRALRIYPPFLFMIAVSELTERLVFGHGYGRSQIITELTWLQDYRYAMWGQTWSLAVEEHFYIVLPLLLVFLARKGTRPPFASLPRLVICFGILELILRVGTSVLVPAYSDRTHGFPTHLRSDSLFFGVVLGYFYHFHRARLDQFRTAHKRLLTACAAACLIPLAIWEEETFFVRTAGFTLSYIAFGLILMLVIGSRPDRLFVAVKPLAVVGSWSYSIYLWHLFVLLQIPGVAHRLLGLHTMSAGWLALTYVSGSIAVGGLMNALIERPSIHFRDRFFPKQITAAGRARLPEFPREAIK